MMINSEKLDLILMRLGVLEKAVSAIGDDVDGIQTDIDSLRTSVDAIDLDDIAGQIIYAAEELERSEQRQTLALIRADLRRVS